MGKLQIDIQMNGNDLAIVDGDFAMVESTDEHQRELVLNNKGDFKQNPTICVGVFDYIDDEGVGAMLREIAKQFTQDGMRVDGINIVAGVIQPVAEY